MILAAGVMIALAIAELAFMIPIALSGRFLPAGSWWSLPGLQAIQRLLTGLLDFVQIVLGLGLFFRPRWTGAAIALVLAHGLVVAVPPVIEIFMNAEVFLEGNAFIVRLAVWETLVVFALLFGVWIALLRRRGGALVRPSLGRTLLMIGEGIAVCAFIAVTTYMAAVVPRAMADLYEAEAPRDAAGRAPQGSGDIGAGGAEPIDGPIPDVDPALFRNKLETTSGGEKPIWEEGTEATLVDFWASWCPPCLAELPHLQELQERVGTRGMKVVLVNVDLENPQAVGRFLKRKRIDLDSLLDKESVLFQALGLESLPSTFVLDAKGRPVAFFEGGMSREELESVLMHANEKRVRETFR